MDGKMETSAENNKNFKEVLLSKTTGPRAYDSTLVSTFQVLYLYN
jgi:hypothetical protein